MISGMIAFDTINCLVTKDGGGPTMTTKEASGIIAGLIYDLCLKVASSQYSEIWDFRSLIFDF
jgi:hypothetical protein